MGNVIDSLMQVEKAEIDSFKNEFNGFAMTHSFRGKKMNGATILTTQRFYFDSTMKDVIRVEDVKNKE